MSSSIDQTMSLYIPHVEDHITEIEIMNTFKKLWLGEVSAIDFAFTQQGNYGEKKRCAHVYFNFWYYNQAVENLQAKLIDGKKEVRIVYDEPEFWIIKINYSAPNFYLESSIFKIDENFENDSSFEQYACSDMLVDLYDEDFLSICQDIHRSQRNTNLLVDAAF